MREVLHLFLASQAGTILLAMVGVAFADFAIGSFAALRDRTFQLDSVAAFLRKHIWGRVAPIGTLLLFGYFGGDIVGQLFMASAIAAATAYAAETAASIVGSLNPPKPEPLTPAEKAAGVTLLDVTNPVPTD